MLGAIIGDVVGSIYEWNNIKTMEFPFFSEECFLTDDSIMTLAIAKALCEYDGTNKGLKKSVIKNMQELGRKYPDAGYGARFNQWLRSVSPKPYKSYGNGSAMRVSPVAYAANSLAEAIKLSKLVTEVTHNHPEGIKGAEATAVATYMALHGFKIKEIEKKIHECYYPMDFKIDDIRPTYSYDVTCQGTVPIALKCFFEGYDFENSVRLAISVGGDSDTIAAITGAVAGAYCGIPDRDIKKIVEFMDEEQQAIYEQFSIKYRGVKRGISKTQLIYDFIPGSFHDYNYKSEVGVEISSKINNDYSYVLYSRRAFLIDSFGETSHGGCFVRCSDDYAYLSLYCDNEPYDIKLENISIIEQMMKAAGFKYSIVLFEKKDKDYKDESLEYIKLGYEKYVPKKNEFENPGIFYDTVYRKVL